MDLKVNAILVPTDLSPEARRAFPVASALARQWQASILLLHVAEAGASPPVGAPLAPPVTPPGLDADLERGRQALSRERGGHLPADLKVTLSVVTAEGGVAAAIAAEAATAGCGLIVLSTHGRGGLRRLVLGSVAEAVLRHARVPVLVIPPPES